MEQLIISGFPGIGKSFLFKDEEFKKYKISDSDSSKFSKNKDGSPNPNFIEDYVEHIKSLDSDIILVSTHELVRKALLDNEIKHSIVVPYILDKEDYLQRYKDRGSPEPFIKLIDENWLDWLDDIKTKSDSPLINYNVLKKGQFLKDIIGDLISKKQ